jgi:hypothetical protein
MRDPVHEPVFNPCVAAVVRGGQQCRWATGTLARLKQPNSARGHRIAGALGGRILRAFRCPACPRRRWLGHARSRDGVPTLHDPDALADVVAQVSGPTLTYCFINRRPHDRDQAAHELVPVPEVGAWRGPIRGRARRMARIGGSTGSASIREICSRWLSRWTARHESHGSTAGQPHNPQDRQRSTPDDTQPCSSTSPAAKVMEPKESCDKARHRLPKRM